MSTDHSASPDPLREAAQAVSDKARVVVDHMHPTRPRWVIEDAEFSALRAALQASPAPPKWGPCVECGATEPFGPNGHRADCPIAHPYAHTGRSDCPACWEWHQTDHSWTALQASPAPEGLRAALERADREASLIHDAIYAAKGLDEAERSVLSDMVWTIHAALRPLFRDEERDQIDRDPDEGRP